MFTGVVRNNVDSFLLAKGHAEEAVFTVLYIFEDRPLFFRVPSDHVYKAGLIADLTANAFFFVKFNAVIGVYHFV